MIRFKGSHSIHSSFIQHHGLNVSSQRTQVLEKDFQQRITQELPDSVHLSFQRLSDREARQKKHWAFGCDTVAITATDDQGKLQKYRLFDKLELYNWDESKRNGASWPEFLNAVLDKTKQWAEIVKAR
jgi:hypothetical protein